MPIAGQDSIESVSQAPFLTIPPLGKDRQALFQYAGVYDGVITPLGISPNFPGGSSTAFGPSPIYFTAPTGVVTTGRFEVWNIKLVNRTVGDRCTIKDAVGNILFDSVYVAGQADDYPAIAGTIWPGFQISQLDSGILYIYFWTPRQPVPEPI